MTALQQIFQGYYENRIESDEPDPERMAVTYKKVIDTINKLQIGHDGIDDIMSLVSQYGAAACKKVQNKAKTGCLNKMSSLLIFFSFFVKYGIDTTNLRVIIMSTTQ